MNHWNDPHTPVTSQTGRSWLHSTKVPAAATGRVAEKPIAVLLETQQLPSNGASRPRASGRNRVKIMSVTIPDVSALPAGAPDVERLGESDKRAIAMSLAEASDQQLDSLGQPFQASSAALTKTPGTGPLNDQDEGIDTWIEPAPKGDPVRQTPPEPTQPSPESTVPDTSQPNVANRVRPLQSLVAAEELQGVVDSILERYTGTDSLVLLFVGSQLNAHVNATTASVAAMLAERKLGSVLLIDSNSVSRQLTNQTGSEQFDGLGEAVIESRSWQPMICSGAIPGVSFLPCGTRRLEGTRYQQRVRSVVSEMRKSFDLICVSAGQSDSIDAKIWSDISDGCYLIVSQKHSNPALAQSAVAELQTSGARLLGCVVTDVEAE